MRTRQVRWFEGMLVLPHHFQSAEANYLDWISTSQTWLTQYPYGIRSVELNLASLENYEVRIPRLQIRMKDGTLVSVPENGQLEMLDVRPAFEAHSEVFVYLLLPQMVPGRPNAGYRNGGAHANGNGRNGHHANGHGAIANEHRFIIATENYEEINSGNNAREIDTHYFNVQLRAQPTLESPGGYESLPLFKLRRSRQPGAVPEIDPHYIPPLLSCSSSESLQQHILMAICSQVGSYIKTQAEHLQTLGGWAEAHQPQVHRAILLLSACNASYPLMLQLFQSLGLHPFRAYTELCRLVGQLSIARGDWQPPSLPMYDHDNLGHVFTTIQKEINNIFKADGTTAQILRFPFVGKEHWMEVDLKQEWFKDGYEFYIGIQSELPPEALDALFADSHLDWKLGSSRTLLQIWQNAESGLSIGRVSRQRSSLPQLKGMTYFKIETSGPYWQQLTLAPTLAVKVNERFLKGNALNQSTITVLDPRNNPHQLGLNLFVLKHD